MTTTAPKCIRFAARGQAIVPVIFVMLILTVLAITFATSAHREIRASANFDKQTQRYFAAQGAVNYAMSALAQTSNNGATYGIIPASAATDANGWMQIGDAWVKIDSIDTAGLIDLNSATADTLNRIPVLQQNPDVVAAIVDWRTAGTQPSANGAKSEYYNTLSPSYDSKNGLYESVEELLLVKGVTPTILYGNPSGSPVDPTSLATQNSSAQSGGSGSAAPTRQANGPPIRSRPGGGSGGPPISSRPGGGSGGPPISSRPGGGGGGPPISSRPGGASGGPPISSRPGGTGGATGGGGGGPAGGSAGTGSGTGGAAAPVGDTDWTDIYNAGTSPLSEMFTTLSWERNVASDGSARVNVNTATAADLTGIGLSQNLANRLVNFRTSGPSGGGTGGGNGGGGGGNGGGTGGGRPTGGGGSGGGGNGGGGGGGAGGGRPTGGASPGGSGSGAVPRGQALSRSLLPGFAPSRQAPGTGAGPGGSQPGGTGGTGGGAGAGGGTGGASGGTGGAAGGTGGASGAGTGATGFKSIADLLLVQGFTQPVLQQVADKLSTDDKAYHEGLVNINTASQETLASVPGMDHATLQAIIGYRQGGQAFQSINDFFGLQGLSRQQFQNVVGHLCTKSSFYRVRVRVRMPGQDSVYAVTALVQLTENGPQILQWKEAQRSPGWAYWVASPTLPTPTPTSSGSSSPGTSP